MSSKVTLREKAIKTGNRKSSLFVYKIVASLLKVTVRPWVRMKAQGQENLDLSGSTILAPTHRSHLDSILLATYSKRRIRALGKESLFKVPVLSYFCAALGAIPVRRGQADRDSMKAAQELLDSGETMIVFPEGGRQSGNEIAECFDGPSWLASKTGAQVIPIGIVGTEKAFGPNSKFIRRSNVVMVVREPIKIPDPVNGKRHKREELAEFTEQIRSEMQLAQDRAAVIQQG